MKCQRQRRVSFRGQKAAEARQKKKEHLERCNAAYQPTNYESKEQVIMLLYLLSTVQSNPNRLKVTSECPVH